MQDTVIEAQKIVLGACLIDSSVISEVLTKLDINDFTSATCQTVFRAISRLADKMEISKIGPLQIAEKALADPEGTATIALIMDLMESCPSTVNLDQYYSVIKKFTFERKVHDIFSEGCWNIEKGTTEASDVLDQVMNNLDELVKHKPEELPFKDIGEIAETVLANTEEAYKKGEKILGLDTGYEQLNNLINGLQRNNLIILAARPAVGKSSMALNIANNVAAKGKHVAYFSLEMSSEQLCQRLISTYSNISLTQIQNGDLKEADWQFLMNALEKIKKLPIHIDQTMAYNVSEIKQKCMQLKAQNQLDCIVIDYLQLITAERMGNRVDEVGYISRELKKLAQTLEVPVIALSQLSRGIESRQDKKPLLSDLRESGSIEQDADIVMFLYRNTDATTFTGEGLPVALSVAKNRQGKLGTVEFTFIGKYSTFKERIL